jgi:hypothetical protein
MEIITFGAFLASAQSLPLRKLTHNDSSLQITLALDFSFSFVFQKLLGHCQSNEIIVFFWNVNALFPNRSISKSAHFAE